MRSGLASPLHMTTSDCLGRPGPQTVGPRRLLTATMLWPEKPKFSLFNSSRVSSGQRLHLKCYAGQTTVLSALALMVVTTWKYYGVEFDLIHFLFGVIGINYLSISISILEASEKPTLIRVFFCYLSEFHYLWETDRFITSHHEGCVSFWPLALILSVNRCAALSLRR